MAKSVSNAELRGVFSRVLIAVLFIAIGACAPDHNRRDRKTRTKPSSPRKADDANKKNGTADGTATSEDGTILGTDTDTIVDPEDAGETAEQKKLREEKEAKEKADKAEKERKEKEATDAKADGKDTADGSKADSADQVPPEDVTAATCKIYEAATLTESEKELPICGKITVTATQDGAITIDQATGTDENRAALEFKDSEILKDNKNVILKYTPDAPVIVNGEAKKQTLYIAYTLPNKVSEIEGDPNLQILTLGNDPQEIAGFSQGSFVMSDDAEVRYMYIKYPEALKDLNFQVHITYTLK